MPGVWPEDLLDFAFLPEVNDRLAGKRKEKRKGDRLLNWASS